MNAITLILTYLIVGSAIGIIEFQIAQHAFKNHPHRDALSDHELFLSCVVKNAFIWPIILFWLMLLGLLKVFIFFRRRSGK
ncbi:MAG: hypothetical protein PHY43_06975 [Verrucomicrobiales bacterium]|nr:hypothetical protein [Verrucomicrobiales bacterium]